MPVLEAKLPVVAGLAFPFFPPRPRHGPTLNVTTVRDFVRNYEGRFHVSPKMNGDRALLLKLGREVFVANRHGSLYSFSVTNAASFAALSGTWCLDGEVLEKRFHPFEVVVRQSTDCRRLCPSVRSALAADVCAELGQAFRFAFQGQAWLDRLRANAPAWEGVVLKKLGSPYLPLSSATQETESWMKAKW